MDPISAARAQLLKSSEEWYRARLAFNRNDGRWDQCIENAKADEAAAQALRGRVEERFQLVGLDGEVIDEGYSEDHAAEFRRAFKPEHGYKVRRVVVLIPEPTEEPGT